MKTLIKSIGGEACEVYAISHHDRVLVGRAVPEVEVYENSVEVKTVGSGGVRYKTTVFSVILCPGPEMAAGLTEKLLRGLSAFELVLSLPRRDGVSVPFTVCGVLDADLSPQRWEFVIRDPELVQKFLEMA